MKYNSAKKGMKLVGKKHAEGGIRGRVKETKQPIEVEHNEDILTAGVSEIKETIVCTGTGSGVSSALNELGGGIKLSDEPGKCHLKEEIIIMNKGNKIKSYLEKGDKIRSGAVKLKLLIDNNGEVLNKKGIAIEGVGIEDLNGKEYQAGVDEENTIYSNYGNINGNIGIFRDDIEYEIRKPIGSEYKDEDRFELFIVNDKMKKGNKIKSKLEKDNQKEIEQMIIRDNELIKAEEGKKIEIHEYDEYIKVNEPEVFNVLAFFSNNHHILQLKPVLKYDKVLIFRSSEDLVKFLDEAKINYTIFENRQELKDYLVSSLPEKKKKNKLFGL